MSAWSNWLPWRRGPDSVASRSGSENLTGLVRFAVRPDDQESEVSERDAYIAELQEELTDLCRRPTPLMERLHLFLSVIEAECSIRIHRGTLPLTNEEFEQLMRAIRAQDGPDDAEEALNQRRVLVSAGYLQVPPRAQRSRRR